LPGGDAEGGEDFGEAFFEAGGEVLEFDDHWGGFVWSKRLCLGGSG
jgi:hypothetical protein